MAYLESEQDLGWEDLSQAIILRAVDDYREARKRQKYGPEQVSPGGQAGIWPKNLSPEAMIINVEAFFISPWFAELTNLDPYMLLNRLRSEMDDEIESAQEKEGAWQHGGKKAI